MRVRLYQAPYGHRGDLDLSMTPDDAAQVAALEARHITPAIEALRIPGHYSLTLEADDLEEDLTCEIVPAEAVEDTLRAMVRGFDVAAYDARIA